METNIKTLRKRNLKQALRIRRKIRVRKKIEGTAARPRLTVFKSAKHIYVQAINDHEGVTLACASTVEKAVRAKTSDLKKTQEASVVGSLLAERLKEKGVQVAVFDRNGFRYTGRVAAIAAAAREAGLQF